MNVTITGLERLNRSANRPIQIAKQAIYRIEKPGETKALIGLLRTTSRPECGAAQSSELIAEPAIS